MPELKTLLLAYIGLNALASLIWIRLAREEFSRHGKWSKPTAIASGVLMHGQALASWALAWVDRGSAYAPGVASLALGAVLFLIGAAVIAGGRLAYGSQARVYGLLEDTLIERGVYCRTRNPQYVGYALMFLGTAVAGGSAWAFAAVALFAGFIHLLVTRVEEPHLRDVFGEPYIAYCARVRRYC